MKKTKRIIISIISIILVVLAIVFVYYNFFYDENKLSIKEREWLDDHKSSNIDINIPNDLNVFGYKGMGIFFDFLEDFEKQYAISFNKNATSVGIEVSGLSFLASKDYLKDDLLIYKDHYILVSKNEEVITDYEDITGSKIGVTSDTLARITNIYNENMTYNTYDSRETLLEALNSDTVKYLIVPRIEYLDTILSNNYKIIYHFSDLIINFYLKFGEDDTLNSILNKFYNGWMETDYEDTYFEYLYNLYVEKLGLTQAETDTLTNRDYTYGFVPSTPYQTLTSSNYGGISIAYLADFSKLSGVEFTYYKFNNIEKLIKNFNSKKIDLMFANSNIGVNNLNIYTNLNNKYYLISPLKKDLNIADIKELTHEKIVVLENTKLYGYLNTIGDLQIEVASDEKDLIKAASKDKIIVIDAHTYDYLVNKEINDYSIRYTGYTNENYSYQYVNNTDALYKLFSAYIPFLDQNNLINEGLISYKAAALSGSIISTIAKYILVVITLALIFVSINYYTKNRIMFKTKIRKEEKLKYVDLLTSLKNRNYLNEKKNIWNQNTIYPQAIIVIDLNNVKYLNDTYGHDEGDKQIKAAANVLIKTQLDNTEIMRTDGNEFMIYMVGYSEKQVLNYMKKLVREFKNLPYEYGAAFGFSMIVDDLKLIDDAVSEATIQMRENKEKLEAKDETED